MKKSPLLLIAILAVFFSCYPKRENQEKITFQNVLSIDTYQDTNLKFSQFCDSVKNISLETNETSLIGNIQKVLIYEGWIFVVDKEMTNSVYIFKDNGEFIKVINHRGKGPKEYQQIEDITIDKNNNELVLLDNDGKKILFYDFFGNYQSEVHIDFWASSIAYIGSNHFLFDLSSYHEGHNLLITDRRGTPVKEMYPITTEAFYTDILKMYSAFSPYKNGVNINFPVSNDVYYFDNENEEIEPSYFIDYSDQGISQKGLEAIGSVAEFRELSKKGLRVGSEFFLESDRYIYMFAGKKNQLVNILIDKKENKWYEGNFLDDSLNVPLLNIVGVTENTFISYLYPSLLLNFWKALPEEEKKKPKNKALKQLIATIDDDDNPILRLLYLKK